MTMKVPPTFSIELGSEYGTDSIILQGHDSIENYVPNIVYDDTNFFAKTYKVGDDLLYHVSVVCEHKKPQSQEVGIGKLFKQGDFYGIKRIRPFYHIDQDNNIRMPHNLLTLFCDQKACEKLVVHTHIPDNFKELLYEPNALITCDVPHLPTPVTVNKNSILGRLSQGLKSITFTELFKKINTSQIRFKATKKAEEKAGVVYYNQEKGALQFFDGKKWRTISSE